MSKNWAEKEFNLADLGDERLNQRLIKLADSFSKSPESPINHACQDWAQTKAAYRFFGNEKVSYKEILESHITSTQKRCNKHNTILAIQDTSYFTYTAHSKTTGLALITRTQGNYRNFDNVGLMMHTSLALSNEGLPLGILDQKIYSREAVSKDKKKPKNDRRYQSMPIHEKESNRWLESLMTSYNVFANKNTQIVTICDREADMYDFFKLSQNIKSPILVRACQNRKVNKTSVYSKRSGEKLWSLLRLTKPQGNITVKVPKQKDKPARKAKCNISFTKFKLNPPARIVQNSSGKLPDLELYAIYVCENYRKGIEPINWMLLTNLPIETLKDALEKIKWYCYRWRIEVFHKILKSGLKVEDCRLSTADRLIRYLALMSIVAWRIFWITLVSRTSPDAPCLLFLNNMEWKILFAKINKNKKIPESPPSTHECVIWLAQLGGFLARKNDGYPGIIHVWRGMKKFSNILEGIELAKDICG